MADVTDGSTVPKLISWGQLGKTHSSASPFGCKVEVALRMAGIDYTAAPGDPMNKEIFVKQKFPVLQHGGKIIPDSSTIFKHLHETYPDKMAIFTPPDAKTKALAHALQRMLEEHTQWGMVYGLWRSDEVSRENAPALFRTIPSVAKSSVMRAMIPLIKMQTKGKMLRDLNGQGLGKHSMEEVLERMDADLAACETLLEGSGAFLTGATPTQADCFLYGLLDHGLNACADMSIPFVHTKLMQGKPALMAFHRRLTATAFPSGRSDKWTQQ